MQHGPRGRHLLHNPGRASPGLPGRLGEPAVAVAVAVAVAANAILTPGADYRQRHATVGVARHHRRRRRRRGRAHGGRPASTTAASYPRPGPAVAVVVAVVRRACVAGRSARTHSGTPTHTHTHAPDRPGPGCHRRTVRSCRGPSQAPKHDMAHTILVTHQDGTEYVALLDELAIQRKTGQVRHFDGGSLNVAVAGPSRATAYGSIVTVSLLGTERTRNFVDGPARNIMERLELGSPVVGLAMAEDILVVLTQDSVMRVYTYEPGVDGYGASFEIFIHENGELRDNERAFVCINATGSLVCAGTTAANAVLLYDPKSKRTSNYKARSELRALDVADPLSSDQPARLLLVTTNSMEFVNVNVGQADPEPVILAEQPPPSNAVTAAAIGREMVAIGTIVGVDIYTWSTAVPLGTIPLGEPVVDVQFSPSLSAVYCATATTVSAYQLPETTKVELRVNDGNAVFVPASASPITSIRTSLYDERLLNIAAESPMTAIKMLTDAEEPIKSSFTYAHNNLEIAEQQLASEREELRCHQELRQKHESDYRQNEEEIAHLMQRKVALESAMAECSTQVQQLEERLKMSQEVVAVRRYQATATDMLVSQVAAMRDQAVERLQYFPGLMQSGTQFKDLGMEDICQFLDIIGVEYDRKLLIDNAIDGNALLSTTIDSLKYLTHAGISTIGDCHWAHFQAEYLQLHQRLFLPNAAETRIIDFGVERTAKEFMERLSRRTRVNQQIISEYVNRVIREERIRGAILPRLPIEILTPADTPPAVRAAITQIFEEINKEISRDSGALVNETHPAVGEYIGLNNERIERIEALLGNSAISGITNDMLCPISHALILDPVIASDGYTYDREMISKWVLHSRRSPMTNEEISTIFTPNRAIRDRVYGFLESKGIKID